MILSSVQSRISAAILAGGRARRFGGADKAALVIDGRRILDRQLAALSPLTDDICIVANDPDRYAGCQTRVIADAIPGAGPLGGLYSALSAARYDPVLVLACDLPFVTGAALRGLADAYAPEWDAVVPQSTRGREPLCAVYARRCANAIRHRIERRELKLEDLLDALHVRELARGALDDEDWLFENVNTPHDYARARSRVELDAKPFQDRITE